jgi:hypothetical protein
MSAEAAPKPGELISQTERPTVDELIQQAGTLAARHIGDAYRTPFSTNAAHDGAQTVVALLEQHGYIAKPEGGQ